mmetsp:Transcript_39780/g.64513  ORF Transcript_39780/g.64513 Transcript_39780/m.64513 type:complete len:296 (+) Transcript_39780:40-927(+)|eukprot:CAMPEP_0184656980 /NCGR_PEP_ID=MMETSP0308-20130426/16885_1 /TAXON_ID=38269 /ORGANISM="Gloeochaete witrockiana, Strain SAG 46.84" /LENGTH=295 /DNA_ID=CAMNT_0027094325 /DNA_START=30 /DNA_END=917 /DNA_ORIENTATION=+
MADGPDELFALRNFFYLGNYQLAINEGSTLSPSSETLKGERDMFVYRSYIAQGNYKFALDEIKDNASIALQSVRLLATYLASEDNKDISLITLKEWLSDPISANNPTLQIIAGIIYCHERNYEEALRCVHQGTTLEMIALMIQVFLRMDRVDLAEKQLKIMQQTEDDATLTQLATAYVSMAQGGAKVQEAFQILQDLSEKYSSTAMLLTGMAVCHLLQGKYEDAEKLLLDAAGKSSTSFEAIINLIAVAQHLKKPQELINRYITQLKTSAPTHPWTTQVISLESSFDRFASKYAI